MCSAQVFCFLSILKTEDRWLWAHFVWQSNSVTNSFAVETTLSHPNLWFVSQIRDLLSSFLVAFPLFSLSSKALIFAATWQTMKASMSVAGCCKLMLNLCVWGAQVLSYCYVVPSMICAVNLVSGIKTGHFDWESGRFHLWVVFCFCLGLKPFVEAVHHGSCICAPQPGVTDQISRFKGTRTRNGKRVTEKYPSHLPQAVIVPLSVPLSPAPRCHLPLHSLQTNKVC